MAIAWDHGHCTLWTTDRNMEIRAGFGGSGQTIENTERLKKIGILDQRLS